MMMGFCSAILHRGIFGSGATGVFRSNRILVCNSLSLAANRMISSESGVEFPAPAPAPVPWLMLKPTFNGHGPGDSLFRFYNLAENRIYNFFNFNYEEKLTGRYYWRFLGTSNGWLGVYDAENHDLWLVDPMMDLLARLPPVGSVVHHLLVLDKGRLAIVAQGSRCNLAFCSLDAASWTSFASERRAYDSFAYSSRDSRLVCIARECECGECDVGYNKTNLEIWNLEGRTPELEWEMHFDLDSTSYRPDSRKLKYIVCDEQSGELFVVVRNVRIRHGIGGSFVDGIVDTEYKGTECYKPFRTTGFEVYRVDLEWRRLILMKDSLQGLAIFVGTNQPIAIPAAGLAGVKPDSVYFTYDSRIKKPRSSFSSNKDLLHDPMHDYRFSGYDFGIFDYMGKYFSHVCKCNPDSDYVHNPMWFI